MPTHLREKRVSKNLRGRIRKILRDLNLAWNSDSKYTHILQNCKSLALESLMVKKYKMLHNFWFMASKFPNVRCPVTEFYADSDEKISFSKFWFFLVDCPKYSFEFVLAIFRKMRGRKISKFRFSGSILNAQKYGEKIFPKFVLFGFLSN